MSLLTISHVTIRIAGRVLLDEADLAVDPGRRIGLVGRNGAGKSTLLKAIAGDLAIDGGDIRLASRARLGRVKQEAPDGEAYFAASLHNTALPMRLKGTLLRATPAGKPAELVLGVGDAAAEEVVLKLDAPFPHGAEIGTVLEFEGTFESFTKAPFTLTILCSQEKIEGWPAKRK